MDARATLFTGRAQLERQLSVGDARRYARVKALCFLEAPDQECVMYDIRRERSRAYRRSLREWSFQLAATRTLCGRSLSRWTFASTTIALGIQSIHPRCELHPKQAPRSQLHVSGLCRNRCVSPIHADGRSSVHPIHEHAVCTVYRILRLGSSSRVRTASEAQAVYIRSIRRRVPHHLLGSPLTETGFSGHRYQRRNALALARGLHARRPTPADHPAAAPYPPPTVLAPQSPLTVRTILRTSSEAHARAPVH